MHQYNDNDKTILKIVVPIQFVNYNITRINILTNEVKDVLRAAPTTQEDKLQPDKRGRKKFMVGPFTFDQFSANHKIIAGLESTVAQIELAKKKHKDAYFNVIKERGGKAYYNAIKERLIALNKYLADIEMKITNSTNKNDLLNVSRSEIKKEQLLVQREAAEIGLIEEQQIEKLIDDAKESIKSIQSQTYSFIPIDKKQMSEVILREISEKIYHLRKQYGDVFFKIEFLPNGHGIRTNININNGNINYRQEVNMEEIADVLNNISKTLHSKYNSQVQTNVNFIICDFASPRGVAHSTPRLGSTVYLNISDIKTKSFASSNLGQVSKFLGDLDKLSGYQDMCASDADGVEVNNSFSGTKVVLQNNSQRTNYHTTQRISNRNGKSYFILNETQHVR